MDKEPRIRHLCTPVLDWFLGATPTLDDFSVADTHNENEQHRVMVDQLLLIVQGIISLHQSCPPRELDQPYDNYVIDYEVLSGNLSRVFALVSVRTALNSFLERLVASSSAGRLAMIQVTIPFLDAYLRLVQNHLLVQIQLVKSSFKLAYVLCRVVSSVVQKGFCKPAEVDEEPTGHTAQDDEILDGTGLGQGTGSKNVSDQIQDESQVEGLREEQTSENEATGATDGDAIEMGELGGDLQNVDGDNSGTDSDGTQPEVDEELGKTDPTDPGAVDEKLWGDGTVPEADAEEQTSMESSKEQKATSQIVAKEDHEKHTSKQDDVKPSLDHADKESADLNDEDTQDDHPVHADMKMDNFIPEADTLDLPSDLDLSIGDDGLDESHDTQNDFAEDAEEDPQQGLHQDPVPDERVEMLQGLPADPQDQLESDSHDTATLDIEEEQRQSTVAQTDLSEGNTKMNESNIQTGLEPQPDTTLQDDIHGTSAAAASIREGIDGPGASESLIDVDQSASCLFSLDFFLLLCSRPLLPNAGEEKPTNTQDGDQADSMRVVGSSSKPSLPNPLRNLDNTIKEIRKRWEQIRDASELGLSPLPTFDDSALPQEVEYLHEGMNDEHSLRALGPAKENKVARLRDLQITDEEPASDAFIPPPDFDHVMETQTAEDVDNIPTVPNDQTTLRDKFMEGALTRDQIRADYPDELQSSDQSALRSLPATGVNATCPITDAKSVELAVKTWQESGHPDSGAGEMWRLYDSLTQDLSFALCEQLRLILEPTLATRLRGDYSTGKRLNMRKIISYIASDYTKDKIWLRRTRPSQREYQILIALDDSRSMAESRSVHLAYETLALVSKALNRLESGEVAIARFGEDVEIVHAFEDGMVGDREGEKMMQRFKFEQRKTDVFGLIDVSLRVLTQARERKSMGRASREAADLWQLEIIISDGICQDHDQLRTILRRAEEQRVMIVFVIIDSLHTHHEPSSGTNGIASNSILSMNQVSYNDVGGGHMDLQLKRYLDSFPFQYYVVLRKVESLPDVLSGTLRQFFQRISEE